MRWAITLTFSSVRRVEAWKLLFERAGTSSLHQAKSATMRIGEATMRIAHDRQISKSSAATLRERAESAAPTSRRGRRRRDRERAVEDAPGGNARPLARARQPKYPDRPGRDDPAAPLDVVRPEARSSRSTTSWRSRDAGGAHDHRGRLPFRREPAKGPDRERRVPIGQRLAERPGRRDASPAPRSARTSPCA